MNPLPDQLCLPLRLPRGAGGLESFVADGNAEVVAALRHWAATPGACNLLLHGEPGSGKSHLLHAACQCAQAAGFGVRSVQLDLPGLEPSLLDDSEHYDAIAIDALHAVAGQRAWELALFNLYNAQHQRGGRLLFAARAPAPALGLGLADLASRLTACATYAVVPLDDAGRAKLLQGEAAVRGLALDERTLRCILTYSPRDTASLLALLDEIERATLLLRRAPTPRLVGELLQRRLQTGSGDGPAP